MPKSMLSEEKRLARNAYMRQWKRDNKNYVNKINLSWRKKNPDKVKDWDNKWRTENPEKSKAKQKRHRDKFVEKYRILSKEYGKNLRENKKETALWYAAKKRSEQQGVPFDIKPSDIVIPSHCPVLGMELNTNKNGPKANSVSLDKVIPEKGYVKGNIKIISWRANTIKNAGTAEEHRLIADYIDRESKVCP